MCMAKKTFTYEQVSTAANSAADMLVTADSDTQTLIDFMVNAMLTALENPEADVEDVIEENYGEGEDGEEVMVSLRSALG